MPLAPLVGHHDVRAMLARAIQADELPQSLLLHGPAGVGKQRLGLWLGQRLLCTAVRAADAEPCGGCTSCRMAERLEHPDLHWFFPLPRPEGASPDRLRDKLEEARATELAARRSDRFYLPRWEKPAAHFVAAVHTMQTVATKPAAAGRRKVLLVGDVEAMTPQEGNAEAANAFLKLLEEPPANTWLLLTTAFPESLLPTIRSRVLPVRLLPLFEADVTDAVIRARGLARSDAALAAARAEGSIGTALRFLPDGDGPGVLTRQRSAGREWLIRILDRDTAGVFAAAHAESSFGGRGELSGTLAAFAGWLRDLAAVRLGAADQVADPETREFLTVLAGRRPMTAVGLTRALARADEAAQQLSGNVNPQLVLANLLRAVRADLNGAT